MVVQRLSTAERGKAVFQSGKEKHGLAEQGPRDDQVGIEKTGHRAD